MFELTPSIMISIIVLFTIIGGVIGNLLFKASFQKESNTAIFHIDKTTGIVSDNTFSIR